jgi:hypothetical protein
MTRRTGVRLALLMIISLTAATAYAVWRTRPEQMTLVPYVTYTSEDVFRSRAKNTVRPACPKDTIPLNRAAVVVIRVYLDAEGAVLHTVIDEAPSSAIGAVVTEAVEQWSFAAPAIVGGRPQALSGVLTFYFVQEEDRCDVLYPKEAGYLGDRIVRDLN